MLAERCDGVANCEDWRIELNLGRGEVVVC